MFKIQKVSNLIDFCSSRMCYTLLEWEGIFSDRYSPFLLCGLQENYVGRE